MEFASEMQCDETSRLALDHMFRTMKQVSTNHRDEADSVEAKFVEKPIEILHFHEQINQKSFFLRSKFKNLFLTF